MKRRNMTLPFLFLSNNKIKKILDYFIVFLRTHTHSFSPPMLKFFSSSSSSLPDKISNTNVDADKTDATINADKADDTKKENGSNDAAFATLSDATVLSNGATTGRVEKPNKPTLESTDTNTPPLSFSTRTTDSEDKPLVHSPDQATKNKDTGNTEAPPCPLPLVEIGTSASPSSDQKPDKSAAPCLDKGLDKNTPPSLDKTLSTSTASTSVNESNSNSSNPATTSHKQVSLKARMILKTLEQNDVTKFIKSRILFNPTLEEYTEAHKLASEAFQPLTMDLSRLTYNFSPDCLSDTTNFLFELINVLFANTPQPSIVRALAILISRTFLSSIRYYGIWHWKTLPVHRLYLTILFFMNEDFETRIEPHGLDMVEKTSQLAPFRGSISCMFKTRFLLATMYANKGMLEKACLLMKDGVINWSTLADHFSENEGIHWVDKFSDFLGSTCNRSDLQQKWLHLAYTVFSNDYGESHQYTFDIVRMQIDTLEPEEALVCAKVLYNRCHDTVGPYNEWTLKAGKAVANYMIKTGDEHLGNLLLDSLSARKACQPFTIPDEAKNTLVFFQPKTEADQILENMIHSMEYGTGRVRYNDIPEDVANQVADRLSTLGFVVKMEKNGKYQNIQTQI